MEFSILMTFGMANSVNLWLPITTLTFVIYNNYIYNTIIFQHIKDATGYIFDEVKVNFMAGFKGEWKFKVTNRGHGKYTVQCFSNTIFFNYVCIFHHQGLVLLILSRINSPCIILLKTIKYLTLWTFLLVIFKV